MSKKFKDLQKVAQRLLEIMVSVRGHGFAVTGLLIDQNLTLMHENRNRMIGQIGESRKIYLRDITSHAQQEIMYWYWQNKKILNLPEPNQLTIITSLDPCPICAASIILSGFNVGTVSMDPYGGVNFKRDGFNSFSFAPKIQQELIQRFGYYQIEGDESRKRYEYGAQKVAYKDDKIPKEQQRKCSEELYLKMEQLDNQIHKQNYPDNFKNLKKLPQDHILIQSLKELSPDALAITLQQKVQIQGELSPYYEPTLELKYYLTKLVESTPQAKNAVALIDTFGNLLLARADRFDISPIHSAMVNLAQDYTNFCFKQQQTASKEGKDIKQTTAYAYLPHISGCTIIFLNPLPADDVISIQAVGLYGFSKNKSIRGGPIYINQDEPDSIPMSSVIHHLPILFGQGYFNVNPILAKITKISKSIQALSK